MTTSNPLDIRDEFDAVEDVDPYVVLDQWHANCMFYIVIDLNCG